MGVDCFILTIDMRHYDGNDPKQKLVLDKLEKSPLVKMYKQDSDWFTLNRMRPSDEFLQAANAKYLMIQDVDEYLVVEGGTTDLKKLLDETIKNDAGIYLN